MWNTILLNIILSIAIIAIAHNIWEYLKTNYSTQKTKNLAEIHAAKYKTILNDLSSAQDVALVPAVPNKPKTVDDTNSTTHRSMREDSFTSHISAEEQAWMKRELDSFIQSL